jgi:4-hydroxy-2-oxovalerate aldolase
LSVPISLVDCTLREVEYEIHLTLAESVQIAEKLSESGVHYLELADRGAPSWAGLEIEEYVDTVARAASQSTVAIMVYPGASLETISRAVGAGAGCVRLAANITEAADILPLAEGVKELGVPLVTFNAMKTYAVSPAETVRIAEESCEAGVDVFYVADSAGCMLPGEVTHLFRMLRDKWITTGFHGHDNSSLAVANSLAALDAGAAMVDGTLRGAGRSAGNAQLEVLVTTAQRSSFLPGVDGDLLARKSEELIAGRRPRDRGVSHLDIAIGEGRFHTERIALAREVAESSGVPLPDLVREVGRRDPVRPSRDLMDEVAKELRESRTAVEGLA